MAKICYVEQTFRTKTLKLLALVDEIAARYVAQGYKLTVRQLYYALVAGGHIPNNPKEYGHIKDAVKNGRMAGLIDWDAIEDRTRYTRGNTHWTDPADILASVSVQYMTDRRRTQPNYIECWIEKDALVGVLEPLARELDVPCLSCRGYSSTSAMREAALRFKAEGEREGRYIIYAGDHDPSGLDIPRAIDEAMKTFGADVKVERIALTREQIDRYRPPVNPAKETDTRAAAYIKEHGQYSWELDALEPQVLAGLYRDKVAELTDEGLLREAVESEAADREKLARLYRRWDYVSAIV